MLQPKEKPPRRDRNGLSGGTIACGDPIGAPRSLCPALGDGNGYELRAALLVAKVHDFMLQCKMKSSHVQH